MAGFINIPQCFLTSATGTEGWHVDGNTVDLPHTFTIIHCIAANKHGPTLLVPLREIVESFTPEERYVSVKCLCVLYKHGNFVWIHHTFANSEIYQNLFRDNDICQWIQCIH